MTEEQVITEFQKWWDSPHPEWKPTIYWLDRYKCAKESWLAAWRKYGREDKD